MNLINNLKPKTIVIYPNYAAKMINASFMLELSHPLLLDPLTDSLSTISVAALVDVSDRYGSYRVVVANQKVHLITIGKVGEKLRKSEKLFEYIRMLPRIWHTVYHSAFSYIFMPGHAGLLASIFCLLLKRPYAIYLRGKWEAPLRIFHWIYPTLLQRAKFVLCTGAGLSEQIVILNPFCEAVIPMSDVLMKDIPPRSHFPVTNRCRLLFVGELIIEKGVFELIDALAILEKTSSVEVELSIVGLGTEWTRLHNYVNQCAMQDKVRFYGFIDDPEKLSEMYLTHDLFCLPTYSEGFPRVIYEAMLFSLPIITTRVGQIDTIIIDKVNGLFVKVRSAQDLAGKIMLLLEKAELRNQIGTQARSTIEPMLAGWRESTHGNQVIKWMRATKIAQFR